MAELKFNISETMTREEAKAAILRGEKITHPVFKPGLYFTATTDGHIIDNNDYPCDLFFARIIALPDYIDGWECLTVK